MKSKIKQDTTFNEKNKNHYLNYNNFNSFCDFEYYPKLYEKLAVFKIII